LDCIKVSFCLIKNPKAKYSFYKHYATAKSFFRYKALKRIKSAALKAKNIFLTAEKSILQGLTKI
jgi:hypothetical protein